MQSVVLAVGGGNSYITYSYNNQSIRWKVGEPKTKPPVCLLPKNICQNKVEEEAKPVELVIYEFSIQTFFT